MVVEVYALVHRAHRRLHCWLVGRRSILVVVRQLFSLSGFLLFIPFSQDMIGYLADDFFPFRSIVTSSFCGTGHRTPVVLVRQQVEIVVAGAAGRGGYAHPLELVLVLGRQLFVLVLELLLELTEEL